VIEAAIRADGIPNRERHAEESLAADAPVSDQAVDPLLVAVPHVLRMPLQLTTARDELIPEVDALDEPLAAGDDFERPIAFFVELDRVRNGARLADHVAGLPQ